MWMDSLTLFTHLFESREVSAGCIQHIIDERTVHADESETQHTTESKSFTQRTQLDFTTAKGETRCSVRFRKEKKRLHLSALV